MSAPIGGAPQEPREQQVVLVPPPRLVRIRIPQGQNGAIPLAHVQGVPPRGDASPVAHVADNRFRNR